ncbi:energy transducer TonB [Luteimonas sp. S4-F44]|uniref:energy transducer TonB n=1 Tax=Luteimonas sp. S4-F44 TaxID=2925842 RepID=UPI001F534041|nr:energy transducer TonB [Luteimonas sp. S4-F44]UNK42026.1 energy transducer TonB [Luteimonas sp. S4-F44]
MTRSRSWRRADHGACIQRACALLGAIAVHGMVVLLVFGLGEDLRPPPPADSVIEVSVLPAAAPPVPVEPRRAPAPVVEARLTRAPAEPRSPPPLPQTRAAPLEPLPSLADSERPLPAAVPASTDASADPPTSHDQQAAAPPSPPAPAAEAQAGRRDDRWEARVMARLARYRHYPTAARMRGEEGVAIVRLRMDRAGRVLSAALARSSGSTRLDAAAIETFHRAAPLPAIPADLPAPIEIAVPVEFFMH